MDSRLLKFGPTQFVEERPLPSQTIEGCLYVCEAEGTVQFLCPCGCEAFRQIPFGPPWNSKTWWGFTRHEDDTITLSPSIFHRDACESHYFIESNQVRWC